MRLISYFVLLWFLASLFLGCKGKPGDASTTVDSDADRDVVMESRGLEVPEEDPRIGLFDQRIEVFSAAGKPDRRIESFMYRNASGILEGFYQDQFPRLLRTTFKRSDNTQKIYEWVYLDDTGRPQLYREIIVFTRCSPQEPGPCVRESRIYLDENGQHFLAKQRMRVLEDAADISLGTLPFEVFTPESDIDARISQAVFRYTEALRNVAESAGRPKAPVVAQPDGDRIYFYADASRLRGKLNGTQPRDYLLRLREAQTVHIRLEAQTDCTMRIVDPAGNVLLPSGVHWEGAAAQAGDLRITVSGSKADASFLLSVSDF